MAGRAQRRPRTIVPDDPHRPRPGTIGAQFGQGFQAVKSGRVGRRKREL
jgi:hypothetical protein